MTSTVAESRSGAKKRRAVFLKADVAIEKNAAPLDRRDRKEIARRPAELDRVRDPRSNELGHDFDAGREERQQTCRVRIDIRERELYLNTSRGVARNDLARRLGTDRQAEKKESRTR